MKGEQENGELKAWEKNRHKTFLSKAQAGRQGKGRREVKETEPGRRGSRSKRQMSCLPPRRQSHSVSMSCEHAQHGKIPTGVWGMEVLWKEQEEGCLHAAVVVAEKGEEASKEAAEKEKE